MDDDGDGGEDGGVAHARLPGQYRVAQAEQSLDRLQAPGGFEPSAAQHCPSPAQPVDPHPRQASDCDTKIPKW